MKTIKRIVCFVLCLALSIPFISVLADEATELSDTVQKTYIEFLLDEIDTTSGVVLTFNAKSEGSQKVNVYAIDSSIEENGITWKNAPGNNVSSVGADGTFIQSVNVNGENVYSIDVTNIVSEYKTNEKTKITFVITPDSANTNEVIIDSKELTSKIVYAPDFDSLASDAYILGDTSAQVQYNAETEYMYYYGGTNGLSVKEVSDAYNYPSNKSGKSLMIDKNYSNTNTGRLKLVNSFVTSASDMIEGTEYQISFKIRYGADAPLGTDVTQTTNIQAVAINTSTGTTKLNGGTNLTVSKNDWTSYSFTYTMTDTAKSMFGFVQNNENAEFYVDDLVITKTLDASKNAPRLVNGDLTVVANADTFIENGDGEDKNYGTSSSLKVSAGIFPAVSTEKVYVKFPLANVDTSETVYLNINAKTTGNQKLNVYATEESFNELSVTWTNAPKNNLEGYDTDGTYIGQIALNGDGTYKIDVTQTVSAYKDAGKESITFALCAESTNTASVIILSKENNKETVYAPDFDNLAEDAYVQGSGTQVQYSQDTEYMFYVGGSNSLELKGITSDYNYPSDSDGKSMKLGKKNSNTSTGRFKLVNSLVKSASDMVEGTVYQISFKIRYGADSDLGTDVTQTKNIQAAAINTSTGTTTIQTLTVSKTDWTEYNLTYTMTDTAKSMFGFVQNSENVEFYVDDLVITKTIDSTYIAPRLTCGESVIANNADAFVSNLKERNQNFGASNELCATYGLNEVIDDYRIISENISGSLKANGNLTYTRTVKNNTASLSNVLMVVAIYDNEDNLVCAKAQKVGIASGEKDDLSVSFEKLPSALKEDSYLKVFTWNEDFEPIFNLDEYVDFYDKDEIVVKVDSPKTGNDYASFYVFVKGENELSNKYVRYNFIYTKDDSIKTEIKRVTKDDAINTVNTAVSGEFDIRFGGTPKGAELSSDKDHTTGSGKSLYFTRDGRTDRIKFYNTFKTTELTKDDIGNVYNVSFWVYPEEDTQIRSGIMSACGEKNYATFYEKTGYVNIEAQKWSQVSFTYTIDETNVDYKIGMLAIEDSVGTPFYIDDISVTQNTTDVTITAKEGIDISNGKFEPKLKVIPGQKDDTKNKEATINFSFVEFFVYFMLAGK